MERGRARGISAVLLAALLLACSAGPGRVGDAPAAPAPPGPTSRSPDSPFPRRDDLDALRRQPAPSNPLPSEPALASGAALRGPLPERIATTPRRGATGWDAFLGKLAEARPGLLLPTEEMRCVAQELGGFLLEHGTLPPRGLQRFVLARCGPAVGDVAAAWIAGDVPSGSTPAQLRQQWAPRLREQLEPALAGAPRLAGIWSGQRAGRAVVLAATAPRELRLDPLDMVIPGDGALEIRGEVLAPAEEVTAILSRGATGFAHCQRAATPALPRFVFHCQADARDRQVQLALSLRPPRHLLGHVAAELLLRAPGETAEVWQPPPPLPGPALQRPEDAPRVLAATLNHARQRAGLAPLALAEAESEVAQAVAPHLFAAMGRRDSLTVDLVMLGLMAGFDVEGLVESGRATAVWGSGTDAPGHLLADALAHPLGREVLMAPDASELAVGYLRSEPTGAAGALLATYETYSETDHAELERRVRERIASARAERGLGPAGTLAGVGELLAAASRDLELGADPQVVLGATLETASRVLQRSVQGWTLEATELDQLELPAELLERPRLAAGIAAALVRPPGGGWARTVVILLTAGPDTRSAALASPGAARHRPQASLPPSPEPPTRSSRSG